MVKVHIFKMRKRWDMKTTYKIGSKWEKEEIFIGNRRPMQTSEETLETNPCLQLDNSSYLWVIMWVDNKHLFVIMILDCVIYIFYLGFLSLV